LVLAVGPAALLRGPTSHGDHSRRLAAFRAATTNSAILGLPEKPGTGDIQNLDAICPDEGREFLTRRVDTGMQMQERLAMLRVKSAVFDPPENMGLMLNTAVPSESMTFCSVRTR